MSEWTVEELDGCALLNRHDGSVPMQFTYISGIKEIARAHKASIAAERETSRQLRELMDSELKRMEKALAAEHEKAIGGLRELTHATINRLAKENEQLREQLAAERENVRELIELSLAMEPRLNRLNAVLVKIGAK